MVAAPFGSDHFPMVLKFESAVSAVPKPTCRIDTREVSWARFHEPLEVELPSLCESLKSRVPPATVYDEFIRRVLRHLLRFGVTRRDGSARRRRIQPLWWSRECEDKIKERRSCYKAYYSDQTAEKKAEFKRLDSKVKIFLKRQKRSSFHVFCESIDPSQGINKNWFTLRALATRTGALRTNVLTDMNSPEFEELRSYLVQEDVSLADIPLRGVGVGDKHLDEPFTRRELDSAMASCRAWSAPGLDGVSYETLRRFSDGTRAFMLHLFNWMFRVSSFPASWRDTYVIFIPNPGGKGYKPISLTSLCKLFKRMVHRRLENQAEHCNWIPNYQFGFWMGRSDLNVVAMVTTNILQGFGCGESVVAV